MIYKFPVYNTFTNIGTGGFFGYKKYMCVDDIGFMVAYNKDSDLTVNNVRRHLMGRTKSSLSIMADGPRHALNKFFDLPGAKIGGKDPESKAMWIDGITEEYPDCRIMHEGDDGLVCGEEYPSGCFFNGFDALDGCSLLKYENALPEFWKKDYVMDRYEMLTGKHRYVKNNYVFNVEVFSGYLFARINCDLAKKIGGDIILKKPEQESDLDAIQVSLFEETNPLVLEIV